MANIIGERLLGNLVYVDRSVHLRRLVDAVGSDVVKLFDDFTRVPKTITSAETDLDLTVTRVETGGGESTIKLLDASGGFLQITVDGNENDGINAQFPPEAFALKTGNYLHFLARGVKLSEITQSDLFIGLSVASTDVLGGVNDRVGFQKIDGETGLKFAVEKDTQETLSAAIHTVTTDAMDLEFFWDGPGNKLEVFVNGASVLNATLTNLPLSVDMAAHWQFLAGQAQSPNYMTCDLDAISVIQIGR